MLQCQWAAVVCAHIAQLRDTTEFPLATSLQGIVAFKPHFHPQTASLADPRSKPLPPGISKCQESCWLGACCGKSGQGKVTVDIEHRVIPLPRTAAHRRALQYSLEMPGYPQASRPP
ncbi:hypothetical protein AOLI_G00134540 [Acnodon oligacanthus]